MTVRTIHSVQILWTKINKFRNRPVLPQKERDLGNRPDGYKTMGVAFLL